MIVLVIRFLKIRFSVLCPHFYWNEKTNLAIYKMEINSIKSSFHADES